MKKRIIIALLCGLHLICFSINVQGEQSVQVPLRSYAGVESLSLGGTAELTLADSVLEEERGDNSVYRLTGTAESAMEVYSGRNYIQVYNTTRLYHQLRINMDVKIADNSTGISLRTQTYSDESCSATNGAVSLLDFSAEELGDGWHTIALDLYTDGSNTAYTVWKDNEIYREGTATVGYGLRFVRIQPTCRAGADVDIYLDDIVISYEALMPVVLDVNNGETVAYDTVTLTVQMDGTMGTVLPSDIVLRCGDEETPVSAVEVQENALLVTPATELVSCSAYTLTLLETAKMADGNAIGQSQTVQFTTTSKPLDICDGSLIQENTVTFSGTYIDAANDTSAQAVLVLYDADGRIVRVEFGEEMQAGAFTLSVENPNAYTAKAFCVTMDFQQVIGDKLF